MDEKNFSQREVFGIVKQLSKVSPNKIILKCQGTILTVREWKNNEGVIQHNYQAFLPDFAGVVEFSSPRLFVLGKPAEMVLTLISFRAYEDVKK